MGRSARLAGRFRIPGGFTAVTKDCVKCRASTSANLGLKSPRSRSSASIEYGKQLQPLAPDPVRNDMQCTGNDEFPGSGQASGPAHLRLRTESLDGTQNSPATIAAFPSESFSIYFLIATR